MYTLTVKRDFVAQHYLIGGDWGAENEKHSHHYAVELTLEGRELDEHGYSWTSSWWRRRSTSLLRATATAR